MIKKIISLLFCLSPITAMATIVYNPGAGSSQSLGTTIDTTTESVVFQTGGALILTGGAGLIVSGDLLAGLNDAGAPIGDLYIETTTDPVFNIVSSGDVNVDGTLYTYAGKTLNIGSSGTIDATFGNISNSGKLNIYNIDVLSSGAITSTDDLEFLDVKTINAGAITNNAGKMDITATGALSMAQFISNSSGITNITANSVISNGSIQNNNGTTNIISAGVLTIGGSLENTGIAAPQMYIKAGATTVAGTVKNDSNTGKMVLNLGSLNVSGGNNLNPSFVNKGDLDAFVSGATNLEYGFDLSAMQTTNTFSFETGTLTFGAGMNPGALVQLFSNNLDSFKLIVNDGTVGVAAVDLRNGGINTNANMDIFGKNVLFASVSNSGKNLNIGTTDATTIADGISILGAVIGDPGSTTKIISSNNLTVGGATTNNGTMILNGNNVQLNTTSNTGTLSITSLTDTTGTIAISGNVSNNLGTTFINARDVIIGGALISAGGTTDVIDVVASDSAGGALSIGSISASGGVINLNSKIGAIAVDNGIVLSGGALNFGADTHSVISGGSIKIGALTDSATAVSSGKKVNVAASGPRSFLMKSVSGSIDAVSITSQATDYARTLILDAGVIDVAGNVIAGGKGVIVFGDNTGPAGKHVDVLGNLLTYPGGTIDMNVETFEVGTLSGTGKFIARGTSLSAVDAYGIAIDISDGILFDGSDPLTGFIIKDTYDFTINTTDAASGEMAIAGGAKIGAGNKLTLNSAEYIGISGAVSNDGTFVINSDTYTSFADTITNTGTMSSFAATITTAGITNSGTADFVSLGDINAGIITNTKTLNLTAANITATAVSSSTTNGAMVVNSDSFNVISLNAMGGYVNLNTALINASNNITTSGNLVQGASTGMLNLIKNDIKLNANNLTVGGDFIAANNSAEYDIGNNLNITGNMIIDSGATADISTSNISLHNLDNNGDLTIAANSASLFDVLNSGNLNIDLGGSNTLNVNTFKTTGGGANLVGRALNSASGIDILGRITQNNAGASTGGDLNVVASDYKINAISIKSGGIEQTSGKMKINTSDLTVLGDISASDLIVAARPGEMLTAKITGDISGGTDFIGLGHMVVGGNYTFDNNSSLNTIILDRDTTPYNYWTTINLLDNNSYGKVVNGTNAEPLISVNGKFISNVTNLGSKDSLLQGGQIGINITDIVDSGTAIWLLHADDGLAELGEKTRNLYIKFCNASGSLCYNYSDSFSGSLPAYIAERDSDKNGASDSLYIVFDPNFGGPSEVFKIQPIVKREPDHTNGEFVTAGALDELIASQLKTKEFFKGTPIELIPLIFKDTNLSVMSDELYKRMEQYLLDRNGAALKNFSRLFQPREIEHIASSIELNEHTTFRDMENRAFDEFIWNRHRQIKKAWLDIDFASLTINENSGQKELGNRFSITGGADAQKSETLILGLTAHISHSTTSGSDDIDLGYKYEKPIAGRVDFDTANTNIGIGGYLTKIINKGARVYGNAFLDLHLISVSREQNYVSDIDGSGTSFSVISEWGILHDWLNQYIVGNVYARAGYNLGFDVSEKSAGADYMKLQSDGYFIFTPGYSLMAQKKIYVSPWTQIRPNISVGAEYDVLGSPDNLQFKFGLSQNYTDYDVNNDPLWMNAGGGVQIISSNGVQIGLDYRYQYNTDIQMHKVKISGSYRF